MSIDSRTEVRVIELVDHVVAGGRCEDDTIDCKTQLDEYTQDSRQPRQIAGLLNAARGRPAMWSIGLDENNHQVVVPTEEPDLARWWPQIQRRFNGIDLDMQSGRVHTDHGIVTVLLFDTSRPPYVINTEGTGNTSREVPWRTATGTHTATRAQLLTLLADASELPDVELISPVLTAERTDHDTVSLRLAADLYFYATGRAVLPKHRWSLRALAADGEWPDSDPAFLDMTFTPHLLPTLRRSSAAEIIRGPSSEYFEAPHPQGVTVRSSGLLINGSDSVRMAASASLNDAQARTVTDAYAFHLTLYMQLDHGDRAITHEITLRHVRSTQLDQEMGEVGRWVSQARPQQPTPRGVNGR